MQVAPSLLGALTAALAGAYTKATSVRVGERCKEQVKLTASAVADGILRAPEVDPVFLDAQVWDGRGEYSYIPPATPHLRIAPSVQLHSEFDLDLDQVTYQVLRNRFWSINLDHSDTIRRVSGSPVIVYMDDFNTALLTETADLLMAGPSIQWFAAVADLPIKWTLEYRSENPGIEEGDVFFTNDPYIGCNHAMDVGMFAPVFWEGRIFSWVFSQCHVGDVGGPMPGSFNPLAKDLYEEPSLVPPIKLVRRGQMQLDVLEMHTRKSRTPDLLALQLRSQMAGIHTVQTRMREVLEEYGAPTDLTVEGLQRLPGLAVVDGQRRAAVAAVRPGRRPARGIYLVQRGQEAGQVSREGGRVFDVTGGQRGARQPAIDRPRPRETASGDAPAQRLRDPQRQLARQHRQPPVLLVHLLRVAGPAGQPHRQVRAEAEGDVVPAARLDPPHRKPGPLRELFRDQPRREFRRDGRFLHGRHHPPAAAGADTHFLRGGRGPASSPGGRGRAWPGEAGPP